MHIFRLVPILQDYFEVSVGLRQHWSYTTFFSRYFSRPFSCHFSFSHEVQLARQKSILATEETEKLVKFMDYLKLMEGIVEHPSAEFIVCQQLISQHFSEKGNMSYLT